MARRIDAVVRAEAEDLLRSGWLSSEVASHVGVAVQTVNMWARKAGIARSKSESLRLAYERGVKSREGMRQANQKYALNEAVFEESLDAARAWVLGVVVGDGCIVRHKGVLRGLDLLGDQDVCEKVAVVLGSTAPVRAHRGTHHVRFNSTRLAASLARFGVGPAKTDVVEWPIELPVGLEAHFLRGFWDADGTVTLHMRRYVSLGAGCRSRAFMEALWARVRRVTGTRARLIEVGDGTYRAQVTCRKAEALGRWLWESAPDEISGSRKRARFFEILES